VQQRAFTMLASTAAFEFWSLRPGQGDSVAIRFRRRPAHFNNSNPVIDRIEESVRRRVPF